MSTMIITESRPNTVIPAGSPSLFHRLLVGWVTAVVGLVAPKRPDGRGITTIEYVIGIVAGITLVGVLILALSNPAVQKALVDLLTHIFGLGGGVDVGKPKK